MTVETWIRKRDGAKAEVKPIDPNRGRRSNLTRTGLLRFRLEGQQSWSTVHPDWLRRNGFTRAEP